MKATRGASALLKERGLPNIIHINGKNLSGGPIKPRNAKPNNRRAEGWARKGHLTPRLAHMKKTSPGRRVTRERKRWRSEDEKDLCNGEPQKANGMR